MRSYVNNDSLCSIGGNESVDMNRLKSAFATKNRTRKKNIQPSLERDQTWIMQRISQNVVPHVNEVLSLPTPALHPNSFERQSG